MSSNPIQTSNQPNQFASFDDVIGNIVDESLNESFMEKEDPLRVFTKIPPGLVEFAESPKYLGLQKSLFKKVGAILDLIDKDFVREAFLLLGKGSGKSTMLEVVSLHGVYRWQCYKDPYAYFKLLPTAKVACVNVSSSRDQAKDVVFEGAKTLSEKSGCFNGKFKAFTHHIEFAGGITLFAGHSNAAAWLGYCTFVGGMDEVEYMVDTNNRSVASSLFNALRGSLRTRFPRHYKLICISSAKERLSFLMKKANAVIRNGTKVEI